MVVPLFIGACASPDTATQPVGKLSDVFATPDWAKFSNSTPTSTAQRAITPDDLVSADGQCSPNAEPAGDAQAPANDPNAGMPDASGAIPMTPGGIGLQMTECQVVQRAGTPDRVEIGAEGTTRIVTMTTTRGNWPGLYRFRGGRLVSIERIEVPAPQKPAKSSRPKKTSQQTPIRGSQSSF